MATPEGGLLASRLGIGLTTRRSVLLFQGDLEGMRSGKRMSTNEMVRKIEEEQTREKMRLSKTELIRRQTLREVHDRLGSLYSVNPSSRNLVLTKTTKGRKKDRPKSATPPKTSKQRLPPWKVGGWSCTAEYEDVLLKETKAQNHQEKKQKRPQSALNHPAKGRYRNQLMVDENGFCEYCEKYGRTKPLKANLGNWMPRRRVAGELRPEPLQDRHYMKQTTVFVNRGANIDVLMKRLQEPEEERKRRLGLRDEVSKQLRAIPATKKMNLIQLERVLKKQGKWVNVYNDTSKTSKHAGLDVEEKMEDKAAKSVLVISRIEFLRTMKLFGFSHANDKLLSRIFSSFDIDNFDEMIVDEFMEYIVRLREQIRVASSIANVQKIVDRHEQRRKRMERLSKKRREIG